MRSALAFLTPLGRATTPSPGDLRWFPLAGACIGAAVGAVWWLAGRWWPPGVAAALALAADLAVTGMLHLDGVVDAADGLLPHLPRSRRLAVMSEPDAGAFGVAAAGAVLLLRWTSLDAVHPSVLLIAGLWCLSRTAMAVIALSLPYARSEEGGGLATAFLPAEGGAARRRALAVGAVGGLLASGLAVAWRPLAGVAAVVTGCLAAAAVAALARRRIGGFTGDVLGAAGVVGETVALVMAAGRW